MNTTKPKKTVALQSLEARLAEELAVTRVLNAEELKQILGAISVLNF